MPHLVILYTRNLDDEANISGLCRSLADTMVNVLDESGRQVFPTGGVRVLAYPAAHSAVADCQREYAFVYLNLRMGRGRSAAVKQKAGDALESCVRGHFGSLFDRRYLGVTLQIDEGQEVYDAKLSSIHPLFNRS